MLVHVEKINGRFPNPNIFNAYYGFTELGADCAFFEAKDLHSISLSKETPVVGGIPTVRRALETLNIAPPKPLDYPKSLQWFLYRKIEAKTFGEVRDKLFNVFVKPRDHTKRFTGKVFETYMNTDPIPDDLPVWVSPPILFKSEYRCFVLNNELIGISHYKGSFDFQLNIKTVRDAILTFTDSPVAYALDFGIFENGGTVLVEVNDAFALGSYGLPPMKYARMIHARWEEMCL